MRWIAILHGRIKASLAATSGIHTAQDVLKIMMVGADAAMLCSVLYRHGIDHIKNMEREIETWMSEHEYNSIRQMQGSMSQENCSDPSEFERAQYVKALHSFKPATAHS